MSEWVAEKAQIRRQLRRRRKAIPQEERRRATLRVNRLLKPWLKRGRFIAVYDAQGSELSLDILIQAAFKRRAVPLWPQVVKGTRRLWFTPSPAPLTRRSPRIRIECARVVLVPLLGVDGDGVRMGQGGGYYDTSLAAARARCPKKIGVGFACQYVERLPHEAHDERLHSFVSEKGRVDFGTQR